MKVIINEQPYKVYWRHIHPELEFKSREIKQGYTKCLVQNMNFLTDEIEGVATCSKNDNFNKSKGRVVSLTKAIKHLPKNVRKQFWDVYKKEIGF